MRSCPAAHVDHTHPDAVIALTSTPDGRRLADETFGDEAVWLDYQRPGFDMSRRIALLLHDHPQARAVLLERHGLVTWGETGEESYEATLEFVSRAARAIDGARDRFGLGGRQGRRARGRERRSTCSRQSLPALRGALLADADGLVLEVDRSPEAIAFASSVRAPEVSQIGAPCPDHLIHTKHKPLVVDFDPAEHGAGELAAAFQRGVEEYSALVPRVLRAHLDDETRQFPIDPAGPRVILVPGVGIVTRGPDAGRARVARDLYHRAIVVERRCRRARRLPLAQRGEAFAIEYWPLERYKLAQAPPRGELAGRIALITGGASGIGRASARPSPRAARTWSSPIATSTAQQEVAEEIDRDYGVRRALAVHVDVTDEEAVVEHDAPHRARVRRPRHPRRLRRSCDERAGHRDHARGLGAQLRGARARLLPRGA